MMTKSAWTITLDPAGSPIVLLAAGDRLQSELSWQASRQTAVVPLVRAAAPALRNYANLSVQIGIARFVTSATDAASRQELIQSLLTIPATDPKPLKIQIDGVTDRYWQFASALVTDYSPAKHLVSIEPRRIQTLSITAAGLSEIAVP